MLSFDVYTNVMHTHVCCLKYYFDNNCEDNCINMSLPHIVWYKVINNKVTRITGGSLIIGSMIQLIILPPTIY